MFEFCYRLAVRSASISTTLPGQSHSPAERRFDAGDRTVSSYFGRCARCIANTRKQGNCQKHGSPATRTHHWLSPCFPAARGVATENWPDKSTRRKRETKETFLPKRRTASFSGGTSNAGKCALSMTPRNETRIPLALDPGCLLFRSTPAAPTRRTKTNLPISGRVGRPVATFDQTAFHVRENRVHAEASL